MIRSRVFKISEEQLVIVNKKQIREDEFTQIVNQTQIINNCFLSINKESIICYQDSTKTRLKNQYSFQIYKIFQILRNQNCKVGIALCDQNKQQIKFYSKELRIILEWETILQKILTKRGFYLDYSIIKAIRVGKFSTVYLAMNIQNGKKAAIKSFKKKQLHSEHLGIQILYNEIKLLRMFYCNNIIKIISVYQQQNVINLVFEYMEGYSLKKILQKEYLGAQQIKDYMKGLLLGLYQLHKKNVVHRDLKPDNIMLKKRYHSDCEIVIMDFGFATLLNQQSYLLKKCGTPGYVAPEILNMKDYKCTKLSDIFSLGCIFYYMLLRKPLFEGNTIDDIIQANKNCQFDLSELQYKHLNDHTCDLLRRMLKINIQERISVQQCLNHPYFYQKRSLSLSHMINEKIENYFTEGKSNLTTNSPGFEHENSSLSSPTKNKAKINCCLIF